MGSELSDLTLSAAEVIQEIGFGLARVREGLSLTRDYELDQQKIEGLLLINPPLLCDPLENRFVHRFCLEIRKCVWCFFSVPLSKLTEAK